MTDASTPAPLVGLDQPLVITLPERHARGRIVRLGPVLDAVLSAHAYPPPLETLLAEGGTLEDPAGFVRRMNDLLLSKSLSGQ